MFEPINFDKIVKGFNDVCSIVMTIFGLDQGFYISEHLALHYFYDYLVYSFDKSVMVLMKIQMKIIK
jgi:hypothetical protein